MRQASAKLSPQPRWRNRRRWRQRTSGRVLLRLPGQYYDAETNLNYNNARYYDSGSGRYVSSDPIGLNGGINTYRYAYANPLIYYDPSGLCSTLFCLPAFEQEQLLSSKLVSDFWRLDDVHPEVTTQPNAPPTSFAGKGWGIGYLGKTQAICLITRVKKYTDEYQRFSRQACLEFCMECEQPSLRWTNYERNLGTFERDRYEYEHHNQAVNSYSPELRCLEIIHSLR